MDELMSVTRERPPFEHCTLLGSQVELVLHTTGMPHCLHCHIIFAIATLERLEVVSCAGWPSPLCGRWQVAGGQVAVLCSRTSGVLLKINYDHEMPGFTCISQFGSASEWSHWRQPSMMSAATLP